MYDGDSAGIHAALRGIDLILKEGLNVRVVLIPDGDDPDSYSRKHSLEEVQSFLKSAEKDFIVFKTDLLLGQAGDDPLNKAGLINDITDTLALVPDQIKRAVYVQMTSQKFGISEDVIYSRITDTRQKMLENERKEAERERMRAEREEARVNANVAEANAGVPSEPLPVDYGEPVDGIDGGYIPEGYLPPEEMGEPAAEAPETPKVTSEEGILLENPVMAPSEKELLVLILKYGLETLDFETDSEYYDKNEKFTVADFIRDAIDGREFANTVYRRTYNEYFRLYDGDATLTQDDIIRKIMDGPDRVMATLAGDLTQDKYLLTVKNFADSMTSLSSFLVINVPRAILVYNSKIVRMQEMEISEQLNAMKHGEHSEEEVMALLEKFQKTAALRKKITERLGRVQ